MIDWRLVIGLGLASVTLTACLAYLMAPPWQIQAISWPTTGVPSTAQKHLDLDRTVRPPSGEEKAVAEFEAAADAILKKAYSITSILRIRGLSTLGFYFTKAGTSPRLISAIDRTRTWRGFTDRCVCPKSACGAVQVALPRSGPGGKRYPEVGNIQQSSQGGLSTCPQRGFSIHPSRDRTRHETGT